MKTDKNFEQKVREALLEECEGILAPDKLKQRIDEEISLKEEKSMKHISMKKIVIGVAAACLLISGAAFAGKTASLETHGGSTPEFHSYGEMLKGEEKLGYQPDSVEQFTNGYVFGGAFLLKTDAKDENRNTVYSFDELVVNYEKAGEPNVSLFIMKPVENLTDSKAPDAIRDCGDITIRYDVYTYKFVPANYELTEEDMENEKKDNYTITYGSDEVETSINQSITWDKDGIHYNLQGFDLTVTSDEMMDMAEEIINAE